MTPRMCPAAYRRWSRISAAFGALALMVTGLRADVVDPAFAASFGSFTQIFALVQQPDGRLVVGGSIPQLGGQAASNLVRLNVDGTRDASFNSGLTAGFTGGGSVQALALQRDGKILVGGYFNTIAGQTRNYLARLNVDGTVDPGFNPDLSDAVHAIAVQPDGKILVGGQFATVGGNPHSYLARLEADGTLDATFSAVATGPSASFSWGVLCLELQVDGRILIGGSFTEVAGQPRRSLARINPDGSLDAAFDARLSRGTVNSLATRGDGRIAVAGSFVLPGVASTLMLARLNANAALDPAFNPIPAGVGVAFTVLQQADGRILLGGFFDSAAGIPRNRVARINPDGSIDASFNANLQDAAQGGVGVLCMTLPRVGGFFIAGSFISAAGNSRRGIARFVLEESAYTFAGFAGLAGGQGTSDGSGASARFNAPEAVAVDSSGNLFIADSANHVIRKVTPAGVVSTVAGAAGTFGSADGTASVARFRFPSGVAVDSTGALFVADTDNHTIRKITPAGVVSTVAGSAGTSGSTDGTGAAARFKAPAGVAVDANGTVYVADTENATIRKITPAGVVTTLAGQAGTNGSGDGTGSAARFFLPRGLAVDSAGNIFVADQISSIRRITPAGVVTTVTTLVHGYGLAVDLGGNLFVADSNGHAIRRIAPDGGVMTLAGASSGGADGTGVAARFNTPAGIAVDAAGNIYVADPGNHTIRKGALVLTRQPSSQEPVAGTTATLAAAGGGAGASYRWQRNGSDVSGGTNPSLTINNVQPADAGVYMASVTNGGIAAASQPAILGVSSTAKVIGSGSEVGSNIAHPNGNIFDQVLLEGAATTITADPGQVARLSFVDLNDDIVQVEFSGAGSLSVVLTNPTGPATPIKYNQPTISYWRGHAGIVITGADETTNVAVFSVGRGNAVNQALFRSDVTYDGFADIAFIAISSANGRFGGLRTANASYFNTVGITGLYAPGVQFTGPVFVGDINAADSATPMLVLGSASDVRITGGDLAQTNGRAVIVSGFAKLQFVSGSNSHSTLFPARSNLARLEENGQDVTDQIVALTP